MIDEIKVFYTPGDIVKLRHEAIENRPTMLVKEKVEKKCNIFDEMMNT